MMNGPIQTSPPLQQAEFMLQQAELRERLADALAAVALYRGLLRLADHVSAKRGRPVHIPVVRAEGSTRANQPSG